MSLKGLRFTLEVDGQEPDTFAVVNFRLIQNQSYPFVMSKRLVRTVLIFTESSDQLSRATDRVPGLPASPGYVQ